MIYTVTFNPSLDYVVDVTDFKLGLTNRTSQETLFAGGKGINVSIVLKNLGLPSVALGFIAGFTGDEIIDKLNHQEINCDFIKLKEGYSRINVKLRSNEETEINGLGPAISKEALDKLFEKLNSLEKGDYLILAGSIPSSLNKDIYEEIAKMLQGKGVNVLVDATGDLLVNVLKYKPFLIKPNNHELEEIFDVELKDFNEIAQYGLKLKQMGAQNVIISMAGDGAIFISPDEQAYYIPAPKGQVKNSVGAGDSMVAGFTAASSNNLDPIDCFLTAVATGSASAFSETLAKQEEVNALLKAMPEIQKIF